MVDGSSVGELKPLPVRCITGEMRGANHVPEEEPKIGPTSDAAQGGARLRAGCDALRPRSVGRPRLCAAGARTAPSSERRLPALVALEQATLTAGDGAAGDTLGYSVALDGDTALVGAYNATVGGNASAGAVYVFTRTGTTWSQQAKLTAGADAAAGDAFGISVALSGDTALVGAYTRPSAATPRPAPSTSSRAPARLGRRRPS